MSDHLVKTSIAVGFALIIAGSTAQETSPSLGIPVTQSQIETFDMIIGPNGEGLPAGTGNALQGEQVFRARCQSCHGADGEGLSGATRLVGGSMQSEGPPLRTVGSYWPHATTVYDFIRRAMPADAPKSLSDIEVYQVTAYVLFLNGIVERDQILNRENLADIVMPNADGFVDQSNIQ
jgi:mono/diheme cytochrome c family protein